MTFEFFKNHPAICSSDKILSKEVKDVHVVLVSLFGRPSQFLIFWGQPPKNCPVSETKHFCFVHSLEFFVHSFLKSGYSLISRLDKKIKRMDKT